MCHYILCPDYVIEGSFPFITGLKLSSSASYPQSFLLMGVQNESCFFTLMNSIDQITSSHFLMKFPSKGKHRPCENNWTPSCLELSCVIFLSACVFPPSCLPERIPLQLPWKRHWQAPAEVRTEFIFQGFTHAQKQG